GKPSAGKMDRNCHSAAEAQIGKIMPRFALRRHQAVAVLNVLPIKWKSAVEAGVIVGIVYLKSGPSMLPSAGEIPHVELERDPLAIGQARNYWLVGVEHLGKSQALYQLQHDIEAVIEAFGLFQLRSEVSTHCSPRTFALAKVQTT